MKKTFFRSKLKTTLLLMFLLFVYVLIAASSYTKAVCTDIANNVFRLHVIANSDSEEDQNLKYIVRDSILSYVNGILENINNKEDVVLTINNHIDEIKNIAQQAVYNEGFTYDVEIEVGNFKFPTKTYGNISFPPGLYDALRVKIGNASGKNWWCVMFPPLCFVDVSSGIVPEDSKELMESNLSSEDYALVSSSKNTTKIKFKVVEVLQNLTINGIFM
ncbi:MAG: stage II sporulation protein R [Clostridia bacterium]